MEISMKTITLLLLCLSLRSLADSASLEIECVRHPIAPYCPAEIQITITNQGSVTASIFEPHMERYLPEDTHFFYTVSESYTNRIENPWLKLVDKEMYPTRRIQDVQPGSTLTYAYLFGIDWDRMLPVFTCPTNRVYLEPLLLSQNTI